MLIVNELGVLSGSQKYFSTPSTIAKKLFYYITRCGHYYCDSHYSFSSDSEIAQLASHLNYLIFYIKQGRLLLETDGKSYTAKKNQIVFIDCTKKHEYCAHDHVEFLWFHFDGGNSQQFFEQILLSKNNKHVFTAQPNSDIEHALGKLIKACNSDYGLPEVEYSQMIYKILCNLMFTTQFMNNDNIETLNYSSTIIKAIHYIDTHLSADITVNTIASSVNLSQSHFSRLFKNQTGYAPHEYIILKRIDKAKFLLSSTLSSVKNIAYEVGYNSEVNFINSFISKVGISPTMFRKNPI